MNPEPSLPLTLTHSITFPAPDPFFQVLLSGFFLLHALFMNMVLGGMPIMVVTDVLRWGYPNPQITRFAGVLSDRLLAAFALAVVLGIVPLIGVQVHYGRVFNEAAGLIGNIWFCLGIGLLMAYGGLHANKWQRGWLMARPGMLLLTGVGSALGLQGVAFVFVLLNVLMLHPDQWVEIQDSGVRAALALASVWPRFLHLVCAAIAGAGMLIAVYGVYLRSRWNAPWANLNSGEEEYGLWVTRFGVIWALTGTLPQIVVGPWLLLALPDVVRQHLIAGDTHGSVAFFLALTSALFGLVLLNAALMVPSTRGFAVAGVICLMVTMGLMVIVRETVRFAWLMPYMEGSRVPSELSWIPILTVVAVLMVGAGLVWRRLWTAGAFTRIPAVKMTS